MAYERDDASAPVFPTRKGEATGASNERTMIDTVGADGIRTQQRSIIGSDGRKGMVRLRTRAGFNDFVTEFDPSDEVSEVVYMDSGAVDLISVNPSDPRSALPAPLYYGAIERSYFGMNKLLGKITPPSIAAPNPPVDGVAGKSFIAATDMTTKKECAAKCPASMFTGKARLYAQAQYGAPSKKWKWTLDTPIGLSPRLVHENGFVMNINTGVYRDATLKHWFVTMYPDGIQFVRMVHSKAVKPLVAKLQDAAFTADWDKIEAYIFAYSSPSSTERYTLTTDVPETQMLGYGWKFNWDGDKADIIQHLEGFPTHRTTHYRFTFSRDTASGHSTELDRWTADLSIVDGPHEWHNSKYSQVIASPDWLTNTLSLFGTRSGGIVPGNVPVYCFYRGNDIEVFRYEAYGGEEILKYSRTATPPTWGLVCDWTSDGLVGMNTTVYDTFGTFGTDGGEGEWRARAHDPVTTGFSCSQASSVSSSQSYTYEKRTLGGKTIGPGALGGWDGYADALGWLSQNVNTYTAPTTVLVASDGVALKLGGANTTTDVFPDALPGYTHTFFTTETQLIGLGFQSGSHTETDNHLLLVPFYDAQATYVYGARNTRRAYDGWTGDSAVGYTSRWGTRHTLYNTYDGGYTYVQEGDWIVYTAHSDSYGLPPSPTYNTGAVDSTDSTLASSLVTISPGAIPFSPPVSLGPFFSGVDFVEQQFHTRSSTLGTVYGYGAKKLDGFPDIFASPPPFTGWA